MTIGTSRFLVRTLGCRVNQYETEYVRHGLLRAGYQEAGQGEPADLCVVNTCTVTLEGDYKSRKLIRKLARAHPRARIVVMGCYAARAPEELAGLPGVVEVLTDKRQVPRLLARLGAAELPDGIEWFGRLHRAYVKVQDGCRMGCSFCIVPHVRPVLWSRPIQSVLDEIRRLVDHGHLEIVLTGVHLGHYGLGMSRQGQLASGHAGRGAAPESRLADLLREIVRLEGHFRVRLSSLDEADLTPELLALMAEHPHRICPHLHIPLQSGSDAVRARMHRRGTSRQFLQWCQEIVRTLDQPALTTDLIVGFPGESEADFQATCRVVQEAGFSKIHVFRFSPRQGTPAAAMPDQIPPSIKRRRAAVLAELGRVLQQRYCQSLVGRRLGVMVEGPCAQSPGSAIGTADRYVTVELPGGLEKVGRLVRVVVEAASGGRVLAKLLQR
ncbi:MAG: tRNA (N(6)-L-threonylcarbamoyladenosine(37)-C(2))-methylthiotransferase MtaB [Thermoguttaceae bacterium]